MRQNIKKSTKNSYKLVISCEAMCYTIVTASDVWCICDSSWQFVLKMCAIIQLLAYSYSVVRQRVRGNENSCDLSHDYLPMP